MENLKTIEKKRQSEFVISKKKFRLSEFIIEKVIFFSSFLAILGVILIFVFVFREALPILVSPEVKKEASLRLFFSTKIWQPISDFPRYGLIAIILGTFKVVVVALFFSIPISVGAAMYTSEFAPLKLKEFIKPIVEILAGIPSVVLGFFALMVMASFFHSIFHSTMRLNAFNAGVALSFAIIPVIYSIAEDALNSVPRSLKEASLALGANRWQTAFRVSLSVAMPGVLAGIILGLGRAVGETMIVLMASGNASMLSANIFDSVRTMSATIAAELGEVVHGSTHYNVLFFIGASLFIFTLIINSLAQLVVGRLQRKLAGKI
ncbi:MAG: phosphate ABC transporter permease subunit PstC [candidate division Zixibacteria bacterium]|nr:phosphate ABC transporter permease subunit PstC [candidate division Zixibacteria bacterium]